MPNEPEHLAEAERHITEHKQRIADQESRIAKLTADGHPTTDSLNLLKQFQETLRLAEGHRELILRELRGEFDGRERNSN